MQVEAHVYYFKTVNSLEIYILFAHEVSTSVFFYPVRRN